MQQKKKTRSTKQKSGSLKKKSGSAKKKQRSIQIEFVKENTTAFGGLALTERLDSRLGLSGDLKKVLPERRGFDYFTIIKSMMGGLITGGKGACAAEDLREDEALLSLLSLDEAPEEATVWRALEGLGELQLSGALPETLYTWGRKILERAPRPALLRNGFFPVFFDGSVLEGSHRREGTKFPRDKAAGMLWATCFAGPTLVAQRLADAGESEQSCVRALAPEVVEKILKPLRMLKQALALVDSLHGDGPTLDEFEEMGLRYIAGANKLKKTDETLAAQMEEVWQNTGAWSGRGWSESGVCACYLQCDKWVKKRVLVGRRHKREGEFIWRYSGVMTDLTEKEVSHMRTNGSSFADVIWRLYDSKMGMETQYKEPLRDMGLHHPPCQEFKRNAGFYAVASLALALGVGVDLIGGQSPERGSRQRQDGAQRKRPRPRRMRLWRLRRRLFALPARLARHAGVLRVRFLGVGAKIRQEYERYFANIARC